MSALLVTGVPSVSVAINGDAVQHKADALAEASSITQVSDALTFEVASSTARALQGIIKTVEKSRTDVKAPVLDLGKRIDATARDFVAPVESEFTRINRLINDYQREQLRIAEEARRKAEQEAARLRAEQERQAAEARKREEYARRAAETAVTSAQLAEAEKAQAAAKQEAEQAITPVVVAPRVVAPPTASGVSVRKEWTFEINDLDALAKSRPELVTIAPKRAEIAARVRAGERDIPGCRIFEDIKTTVRA